MSWVCPSCGQEWPEKPLVDGTIGCPSCGNVAEADLSAAEQERDGAIIYAITTPLPDGSKTVKLLGDTPAVQAVMEMRENLRAAEQERDELRDELNSYETPLPYKVGYEDGKRAAEARAEAAEQALHEIAAADGSNDPTWWGSSPEHLRSIARAALGEALAEVLHECGAVLPGGMQYEKCVRVEGHTGPHITLRGDTWAASARSAASASGS